MGIFEPVNLRLGDNIYTVKSDRVMGLIEAIEDHVVMFDLVNPQHLRNVRLAKAYHAALVYAGADCTLEQVYDSLFDGNKDSVISKINGLLSMMIPPERLHQNNVKKKILRHTKIYGLLGVLILAVSAMAGVAMTNFGHLIP
jgi:hypothetical protein